MRNLTLLIALGLLPCFGCRNSGQQVFQPQPFQQAIHQPGFEQTFPPQQYVQQSQPGFAGAPMAERTGQFLGSLAGGFVRSASVGAGLSAGRDLWNAIVN